MKARICIMALLAITVLCVPMAQAGLLCTIYEIQAGAVPENTVVDVRNVVVTGVGFYGFYAQETDPHPVHERRYSGIWVYTNQNHSCHKGDLVNIYGLYKEYFGFSEIDLNNPDYYYESVGTATIPDPVEVLISEIATQASPLAEAYEGVLVRVDRNAATLYSRAPNQFNEWYVSTSPVIGQGDSMMIAHENAKPGFDFEYDTPEPGSQLTFVQGPLKYSYNNFKIVPRDCPTDLGAPCPPNVRGAYATGETTINVQFGVDMDPVTAGDPANYFLASGYSVIGAQLNAGNPKVVNLTTEVVPNGDPEQIYVYGVRSSENIPMSGYQTFDFRSGITPIYQIQYVDDPAVNDASPLRDEIVTIQGRVTGIVGNYYWLQDGDGGPWCGLYSRVAKSSDIRIGDEVQVSGRVTEYFGATQLNFRAGVNNFRSFGPAADQVVVNLVTADEIPFRGSQRTAEPFEHALVRLEGAYMDSLDGLPGPYYYEWLMFQDGVADTAACDLRELSPMPGTPVPYDACIGNIVDMTGILTYTYGKYKVSPRTGRGGDIIEIYAAPGCGTTSVAGNDTLFGLALEQNRPNPFTPGTTIAFRLPKAGDVSLEVIDIAGRRVRTLASGQLGEGEHLYVWDGTDQSGRQVAAGTYFYRLRGDGQELSRKMVLVQ